MSVASSRTGAGHFPATEWSVLVELSGTDDPARRERLGRLLSRYWRPVFHYVRAIRQLDAADAEDYTQGFFATLLGRIDFARLSPEKGSFRNFLKISLRNYVLTEGRRQAARVQLSSVGLRPGQDAAAEAVGANQPPSPDAIFEQQWLATVLEQATERLRAEYQRAGKDIYFQIFQEYCIDPAEGVSYETLAAKHGLKPDDVRNYLRFARRRGRELVRDVVRESLLPGQDLEEELRAILAVGE